MGTTSDRPFSSLGFSGRSVRGGEAGRKTGEFLLGTHVASSGDSGVIKARAGARGTQATAECVGMEGGEKALLAKLSESRVRWCGHPRPERTETERMERVSRVTHVRHPPPRSPPPLTILPCFARSSTEEKRETSSTDVHGSPIRLPPFLSLSPPSPPSSSLLEQRVQRVKN